MALLEVFLVIPSGMSPTITSECFPEFQHGVLTQLQQWIQGDPRGFKGMPW